MPRRVHKILSHQTPNVIAPDKDLVLRAFHADTSLFDGMNFDEEEHRNWGVIADDFVITMKNKRIKGFVTTVHAAKIETERKMRLELD